VRTQDEFLSVASHELRTPVATVKATAQVAERALQRGELDAERMLRYLDIIARSADRLTSLVDDLLDMSRLRTGQVQMRRQTVNLGELVQHIIARHQTTEAGSSFQVTLPDGDVLVDADPLRIEQVADNLLSNAVKYSPAGSEIRVLMSRDAAGVTVHVADRGIGLPPGQEAHIFEPFGRAPNATTQQIPGLGLGLAICRQLIEAHGGRIWAESAGEHQGTTVSFWLPTAKGVE
jgi:signal transduction histidine kinase